MYSKWVMCHTQQVLPQPTLNTQVVSLCIAAFNHTTACSFCHPFNAGLLHSFSFVSEVCFEVLPKQSAKVLPSYLYIQERGLEPYRVRL